MKVLSILFFSVLAGAQGFVVENFSGGVNGTNPTATQIAKGYFGSLSGINDNSACNLASSSTKCLDIGSNNNSFTAISLTNTWRCSDGIPSNSGGSSALYFDYDGSVGGGHQNIYIGFELPSSDNGGSAVQMLVEWTCIPTLMTNSGTIDDATITGTGTSALSNLVFSGGTGHYRLEGTCGQNGWPAGDCDIPAPINTTFQLAVYLPIKGACSGTINTIADAVAASCIIIATYDRTGSLLGFAYKSTGGTPGTACSGTCQPTGFTMGDLNGAITSSGHIQHANLKMCQVGCTSSQFPLLETPVPLWDGIITPPRATDWTQAGISGGIPSGSWTQCGSTLAAGSYNGSTITTTLAGCGANTYYLLGSGTFNVSGAIQLPTAGHVELRGSGSNSTFLVMSGTIATCGQVASAVCMVSSDTTYSQTPPANTFTWTAGFAQSSTSVTLSTLAGSGPTAISTTNPTLIWFDQCDTGYSGVACATGNATDNSQMYVCGDTYNATGPHGCSANGGGSGARPHRDQLEVHIATAVNTGTGVVTLATPIIGPNWVSGQNPQAWLVNPATQLGVSNLSIDPSGATSGGTGKACVDGFNLYQFWVSQVRCINPNNRGINIAESASGIVVSNYVYGTTGTQPSIYGIRMNGVGLVRVENNILQQSGPIFHDGAASGNVIAYNFCQNGSSFIDPSNALTACITDHAYDYFNLFEGNVVNQVGSDDIHASADMETRFRNFLTGWDSVPSAPITSFTNSVGDFAYARYANNIASVMGTPTYHTGYSAASNALDIYWEGGGPGSVPTDSLTKSTSIFWGSYDTVTAAVRYCGNSTDTGWSTTCSSTAESAFSASTYPGFVPVLGDTSAGQDALPASLYLSTKPSWWFPLTIPFPAVGPDISSGNVGVCSGTINTVGHYSGVPATANGQCTGTSLMASAWGGHVNAIPAMNCYLNTMSGPPDGSGSALSFDAGICYAGTNAAGGSTAGGSVTISGSAQVH